MREICGGGKGFHHTRNRRLPVRLTAPRRHRRTNRTTDTFPFTHHCCLRQPLRWVEVKRRFHSALILRRRGVEWITLLIKELGKAFLKWFDNKVSLVLV